MSALSLLSSADVTTIVVGSPVVFVGGLLAAAGADRLWWWLHNGPDCTELDVPVDGDYSDVITKPYPPKPTEPRATYDVEHELCEADDCDDIVCLCENPDDLPCLATVERGCAHPGVFVCDRHRLDACTDCRIDARCDAGVLR